MRVAIVHERLDVVGGAEKVILALHDLYPDAPIFTSFVDYDNLSPAFKEMDIRTSYMQKLPKFIKRRSDKLLPLYMLAFQDFDLADFDVVISSSYVGAKSILTRSETCHICYCYTPMRFAWDMYHISMRNDHSRMMKWGIRLLLHYFRLWDVQTTNNVDFFIAISETVRQRIRKHYRRESAVIFPPVETERFRVSQNIDDYYIVVSRLVPYKRIDLAVEACTKLNRKLLVIGTGRSEQKLMEKAGPSVKFLGWQSDETVAKYLSNARALLFPGEEDFGILPLEAQAAGTPVIAYGKGGVKETVVAGKTGNFFYAQTAESLAEAIVQFESFDFDRMEISEHAHNFDESQFRERMDVYIQRCYSQFQASQQTSAPVELNSMDELRMEIDSHIPVHGK